MWDVVDGPQRIKAALDNANRVLNQCSVRSIQLLLKLQLLIIL